jgi:hypothetical protein
VHGEVRARYGDARAGAKTETSEMNSSFGGSRVTNEGLYRRQVANYIALKSGFGTTFRRFLEVSHCVFRQLWRVDF